MWPQIILLALSLISLGMDLANDGKIVSKKTSFWTGLLAFIIVNGVLYWGGWFDSFLGR